MKKAGGAEQYNADQRYSKAVVVAAEACAEDTKGQTCYICTQALHWKTKEGLVRGCSCRGTAGFAHVSCLAEEAKILREEAEENNLDWKAKDARWERWVRCGLCEQQYHGVVACALGWACWKTYSGRPEADQVRGMAMSVLGNGLSEADNDEDALTVQEAKLSMMRRLGASEADLLRVQNNLAAAYFALGRSEQALQLKRDVYSGRVDMLGEEHEETLRAANNYANSLVDLERFEEAKALLRRTIPVTRRVLGDSSRTTLAQRCNYAESLYEDPEATLDDLREAVTTLEEVERIARRVLGGAHPLTVDIEGELRESRAALRAREASESGVVDVTSIREALEAMPPGDAN